MPKPGRIGFGEMFTKLKVRRVGQEFHTFRGYDVRKDRYFKGQIDKLQDIEINPPHAQYLGRAKLISVVYSWSDEVPINFIHEDTYDHFDRINWMTLMTKFYGMSKCYGMILNLMWTEVVP